MELTDAEKIERQKKKLFDRLRKLNKITSEEKLKELDKLFAQKKGGGKVPAEFCMAGLEITLDQLLEVFNDISDQTNCPVKYVKERIGRIKDR